MILYLKKTPQSVRSIYLFIFIIFLPNFSLLTLNRVFLPLSWFSVIFPHYTIVKIVGSC